VKYTPQPPGHWNSTKGSNMRFFFEDFAKKRNLDPLLPETWYNTSRQAINEIPVCGARENIEKFIFLNSLLLIIIINFREAQRCSIV
jgi:hypothetical protein